MAEQARVVIIGAGIVGCSAAYHLTKMGWRDVLVVDQGPLFATGGSTSHAPGQVFQVNASRTVCQLARESVELFGTLHSTASRSGSAWVAWRWPPRRNAGRS